MEIHKRVAISQRDVSHPPAPPDNLPVAKSRFVGEIHCILLQRFF